MSGFRFGHRRYFTSIFSHMESVLIVTKEDYSSSKCANMSVHVSVCGFVCEVLPRVAELRAASPFGLPDGDLVAPSLCAL